MKEVLLPPSEYLYHAQDYEDLAGLLKDDNKIRVAGIDVDGVLRGKVRCLLCDTAASDKV